VLRRGLIWLALLLVAAGIAASSAGAAPSKPDDPKVVVGNNGGRYGGDLDLPGGDEPAAPTEPGQSGGAAPPPPGAPGGALGGGLGALLPLPGGGTGTVTQAAQNVHASFRLPDLRVSRDPVGDAVVGLPTWLWVDSAVWSGTYGTSLTLAGVTLTLTARPVTFQFDPGDGHDAVDCGGSGTPYAPDASGCTYTYTRSSGGQPDHQFAASVTVVWQVTWTATTGEAGTFPLDARTRTLPVRVIETQVVGGR
jgi:hypothetical protein